MQPDFPAIDLRAEPDFALGAVQVRPRSREIVSGGASEVLEPRIMQVLVALARRRGAVVSRDELTWSCWGGRVVGDDAIYRCIQAIRQRADVHGGFTVTTLSRVGYRLDEAATRAVRPAQPVLAVLAFDNLTGDPGMAWFSDGLSVEIMQAVAQGADLRTIGRGSSFQFRGAAKAARKVGARLQATHVLDGAVRRSGARVRISAQLVDCADETTLWSQSFERGMADIFAVQDEIAGAVAAALKLAFAPARTASRLDGETYELYLRSRDPMGGLAGSTDEAQHAGAIALLAQVTARAPGFARGWADLAMRQAVYLRRFGSGALRGVTPMTTWEAAERALRLDPGLGVAYQAVGALLPPARYRERAALHARALAAAPRDCEVFNLAGQFCAETGRLRETFDHARRAVALDPLHWPAAQWYAGMLDAMGHHDEAAPLWDAYLARWPDVEALAGEAIAGAANAGDWARFEALADAWLRRGPGTAHFAEFFAYQRNRRIRCPAFLEAHRARVADGLRRDEQVPLRDLVRLSMLGLTDEAFDIAGRASFDHLSGPDGVALSGIWAPGILFVAANRAMIADRRFAGLCARLGLVDYWVASGAWPDCADDGVLPYDFKEECRRLAG